MHTKRRKTPHEQEVDRMSTEYYNRLIEDGYSHEEASTKVDDSLDEYWDAKYDEWAGK